MQKECVCVEGTQHRPHTNAPDDVCLEIGPKQSWPEMRGAGWSALLPLNEISCQWANGRLHLGSGRGISA